MANKLGVDEFSHEEASIDVEDTEEGVLVNFHGKMNIPNPTAVYSPFFDDLHDKIVGASIKEVVTDFTDLKFLNSSGLKTIIRWVMQNAQEDEDKQYRFRIIYSEDIGWQTISLTTFKDLVPDLVEDEAR